MPSSIHSPGITWHSVRSRIRGSMSGSASSTVFCQNVPATTVYSSRWAPAPSRPSWVSPPPAATGVPGRSPVSPAAAALTSPTTVPGSTTGGKTPAGRPLSAGMVCDQRRLASENMPELDPQEGSVTCSPVSRYTIQSLSMPRLAVAARMSGRCRASQRSRAGEVMDTQSPASA